jgi:hypothetical protein
VVLAVPAVVVGEVGDQVEPVAAGAGSAAHCRYRRGIRGVVGDRDQPAIAVGAQTNVYGAGAVAHRVGGDLVDHQNEPLDPVRGRRSDRVTGGQESPDVGPDTRQIGHPCQFLLPHLRQTGRRTCR